MPKTYIEAVYVELKRAYGLDPNDVDLTGDRVQRNLADGLTPEEVVAHIGEKHDLVRLDDNGWLG